MRPESERKSVKPILKYYGCKIEIEWTFGAGVGVRLRCRGGGRGFLQMCFKRNSRTSELWVAAQTGSAP